MPGDIDLVFAHQGLLTNGREHRTVATKHYAFDQLAVTESQQTVIRRLVLKVQELDSSLSKGQQLVV